MPWLMVFAFVPSTRRSLKGVELILSATASAWYQTLPTKIGNLKFVHVPCSLVYFMAVVCPFLVQNPRWWLYSSSLSVPWVGINEPPRQLNSTRDKPAWPTKLFCQLHKDYSNQLANILTKLAKFVLQPECWLIKLFFGPRILQPEQENASFPSVPCRDRLVAGGRPLSCGG